MTAREARQEVTMPGPAPSPNSIRRNNRARSSALLAIMLVWLRSSPLPPFDDAAAAANQLLASWAGYLDGPKAVRRERGLHQYYVAFGLCAHAHRLAAPVISLLRAGLVVEAMPLVRAAFECSLTAQWVVQVEGAVEAYLNEQQRQRRNLLALLPAMRHPGAPPGEVDDALAAIEDAGLLPTDACAKRIQDICDDLEPGGKHAYAIYRMLCQFTHPTDFLLDHYFQRIEKEPGFAVLVAPREEDPAVWMAHTTATLVWAGAAVDFMDPAKTRRSDLQRAETFLGITRVLRPSQKAIDRARK